jgi:hypothetical protein
MDFSLSMTMEPAISNMMEPATSNMMEPAISNMMEPATSNMMEPAISNMMEPAMSTMMEPAMSTMMDRFESNIAYQGSRSPSHQGTPRPDIPIAVDVSVSGSSTCDVRSEEVPPPMLQDEVPPPMLQDYPPLPRSVSDPLAPDRDEEWLSWHDKADHIWACNERAVVEFRKKVDTRGCKDLPLIGPPPRPPMPSLFGGPDAHTPYAMDKWKGCCSRWFTFVRQYQQMRAKTLHGIMK